MSLMEPAIKSRVNVLELIKEECAAICDREADRQCAFTTVDDPSMQMAHVSIAWTLMAVAQRIREIPPEYIEAVIAQKERQA